MKHMCHCHSDWNHGHSSFLRFRVEDFFVSPPFLLRMTGNEGFVELLWGSSHPVIGDLLTCAHCLPLTFPAVKQPPNLK